MGIGKATACTIGGMSLLYCANEASAQGELGGYLPEAEQQTGTARNEGGRGSSEEESRFSGFIGTALELGNGRYGTLGGRGNYDFPSDIGDLRLSLQAEGGLGVDTSGDTDFHMRMGNVGLELGFMPEPDSISWYYGIGLFYDAVSMHDDNQIELNGDDWQLGLRGETAFSVYEGSKLTLMLQLALDIPGSYDGDITGTKVTGDYGREFIRARAEWDFLDIALRAEFKHESVDFSNLIESYVTTFRFGAPIPCGDFAFEPYLGARHEHVWYPRTSQGAHEVNWYGGVAATWYPMDWLGAKIDLRLDEEHGLNPRFIIVIREE